MLSIRFLLLVFFMVAGQLLAVDTCVDCHGDERLQVTNKKLWDYYQDWTQSIHYQEDVHCIDCHGGDPKAKDMEKAHGRSPGAPVEYKAIAKTCGHCHEEILHAYQTSAHAASIKDNALYLGPTCVTCHGSLNARRLNIDSVSETCASCHNDVSGLYPDLPRRAERALGRMLTVHQLYRYVSLKATPERFAVLAKKVDQEINALNTQWHTFDIDAIEATMDDLLVLLQEEKAEIRRLFRDKK
jgi:formate-dependent nitrite reductase cytochrome c552 subunit